MASTTAIRAKLKAPSIMTLTIPILNKMGWFVGKNRN